MLLKDLLDLGERIGSVKRGLSRDEISRFPVRAAKVTSEEGKAGECSVCYCSYEDGDKLRQLPCFHEFHVDCIDRWIKVSTTNSLNDLKLHVTTSRWFLFQEKASCPICRVDLSKS